MPARNSPLSLNQRVIDIGNELRRLRTAINGLGGAGFDPNADPIVIGNGASAPAGPGAVVAGPLATASGIRGVAFGYGTAATGNRGLAVGPSAFASGDFSVSIGYGSSAEALNAAAFGRNAHARHIHATAVGNQAATTDDFQIIIGTALDYIEIPGNGIVLTDSAAVRWRVTVDTSGALTVAAA